MLNAAPPLDSDLDTLAKRLAEARRSGTFAPEVDLGWITERDLAMDFRDTALSHLNWNQVGYALVGKHPTAARTLRLDESLIAPLHREALLDDGARFSLPQGVIGAGVGLTFLLGRPFPFTDEEAATPSNAATACVACRLDLHLLGRRTPAPVVLTAPVAIADFGLDVVHVAGPWTRWADTDWPSIEAALAINDNVLARGHEATPMAAVTWLASQLTGTGSQLNAGDCVAIGSCTGLVQVLPGQLLQASFGDIGRVTLRLC